MMFVVMMVGAAAVGAGVVGDAMRFSMGLENDETAEQRFRHWLSSLVAHYLAGSDEFARVVPSAKEAKLSST